MHFTNNLLRGVGRMCFHCVAQRLHLSAGKVGPCAPPSPHTETVRWLQPSLIGQDSNAQRPDIPSTCYRSQITKRSRNSPVKVVEEGEEIEGQLTPRLLLTVTQGVCVHDHRWVIGELRAVCWTVEIPAGRADTPSSALRPGRDMGSHQG